MYYHIIVTEITKNNFQGFFKNLKQNKLISIRFEQGSKREHVHLHALVKLENGAFIKNLHRNIKYWFGPSARSQCKAVKTIEHYENVSRYIKCKKKPSRTTQ